MKIYVYPVDNQGCGHYRMVWPAMSVKQQFQEHEILIVPPNHPGVPRHLKLQETTDAYGNIVDAHAPADADVIVLQRVTHPATADAITMIRNNGCAVVVDIDDDLSCIHPENPAWTYFHPRSHTPHSWLALDTACKNASLVTTSTQALANTYAAHGRYAVLPNYVPESYLQVTSYGLDSIGWGGSVHSHPDDLQELRRVVARLNLSAENPFRVVGTGDDVADRLGLPEDAVRPTGAKPLNGWPATLAATLGIGLVPLADTRFNAAKSWLKGLEYAAVGIPWIASDRAEYRNLAKELDGYLAKSPRQWVAAINALRDNPTKRAELSLSNRAKIRQSLTIERNASRWVDAWLAARHIG